MVAAQAEFEIYDGRACLGAVALRAGKYLAADAEGRKLGSFATRRLALDAVTARATKLKTIAKH